MYVGQPFKIRPSCLTSTKLGKLDRDGKVIFIIRCSSEEAGFTFKVVLENGGFLDDVTVTFRCLVGVIKWDADRESGRCLPSCNSRDHAMKDI